MPKPEDAPLILWFDLETTGSSRDSKIIEFGGVLTDRDLNVVSETEVVIRPYGWPNYQMDPVVVEMHERSGLMYEVGDGMTISAADTLIADWLRKAAKEAGMGSTHIPYAGSGVGHFDRKFVTDQMPLTSKRLSYWPYDVSPIRRAFRLWGIEVPGLTSRSSEAAAHRALFDAYDALVQFRVARDATQHAYGLIDDRELEERITGMPVDWIANG